jgi:hypothetical protein
MHLAIQSESDWRGAPRYVLTGAWNAQCPAVDPGAPTSGMSTWQSPGCTCHLSGLGLLAAASTITAAQALQMAIQDGQSKGLKLNPRDINGAAWIADATAAIASGAIPVSPPFGPNCSGQTASNMNLLTTGTGIALSAGGAAIGIMVAKNVISAVTGAVIGAATLGIGALISVIAMIFEHHAAAVKRDLAFGCSALPAVNNAFAVIDQAVHAGQTTPAAAAQALDTIYSNYESAGAGGAINNSPWCNSNCELGVVIKGMVLYRQSQYAAMAAAAPQTGAAPQGEGAPAGAAATAATGASVQIPGTAVPNAFPSGPSGWLLALLGLGAAWWAFA